MRIIALLILVILSINCYSQTDYKDKLIHRQDTIRKWQMMDNEVIRYGHNVFIEWRPDFDFSAWDVVNFKYCIYTALIDNKGVVPGTASTIWKKIRGPHPYIFLRDTAEIEDLRIQLTSKNTYLKVYSFAALAHRKVNGLFDVIINNLQDSVQINYQSGDYGDFAYPAELMIWYNWDNLTVKEKDEIIRLIDNKHNHLIDLKTKMLEKK